MTLAAEVALMLARADLIERQGLRESEVGELLRIETARLLPMAERIVAEVLRWQASTGPMLATLADAARRAG